jgi:hypothetical protein
MQFYPHFVQSCYRKDQVLSLTNRSRQSLSWVKWGGVRKKIPDEKRMRTSHLQPTQSSSEVKWHLPDNESDNMETVPAIAFCLQWGSIGDSRQAALWTYCGKPTKRPRTKKKAISLFCKIVENLFAVYRSNSNSLIFFRLIVKVRVGLTLALCNFKFLYERMLTKNDTWTYFDYFMFDL